MIKATETALKGCFIIEPKVFEDERGYFFESFNHKAFCDAIGQEVTFVQDNQSFSKRGVLRGLHFQKGNTPKQSWSVSYKVAFWMWQ